MNKTLNSKWLVDVTLFAVFLIAFFLDLTGLALHQWIGVAAGALALYHLATHGNWVITVTGRFFGKTTARARLYYLLDGLIFAGFLVTGLTGLVISTWLDLTFISYAAWASIHIQASIVTLVLTVVKIGLHWRWIVATGKKIFQEPGQAPQRRPIPVRAAAVAVPAQASRQVSRRDFINLMGLVSVSAIVALSRAAGGLGDAGDGQPGSETIAGTGPSGHAPVVAEGGSGDDGATEIVETGGDTDVDGGQTGSQSVVGTRSSGSQPVTVEQGSGGLPEATPAGRSCVVSCDRRCSYPGHCRRYIDLNGNNRCDHGECA